MKNLTKNTADLISRQQKLLEIWEEHTRCEFEKKNVEDTMDTMSDNPYVFNVPTHRGGEGSQGVFEFYSESFVHSIPPDTETILISRTIGENQIVDEVIFTFTHTIKMEWMLPGIEPTGKHVEVPLVAIVAFEDEKIAHEHIYWDQANVLCQIGLLDKKHLPIVGRESAQYLLRG